LHDIVLDAVGGDGPEDLFIRGWEDLYKRLDLLRQDLAVAERRPVTDATKQSLLKQLDDLVKIAALYENRWLEFERRKRELEKLLD
jgi:hypothetical protein